MAHVEKPVSERKPVFVYRKNAHGAEKQFFCAPCAHKITPPVGFFIYQEGCEMKELNYFEQVNRITERMAHGGVFLSVAGDKPNTMTIGWGAAS